MAARGQQKDVGFERILARMLDPQAQTSTLISDFSKMQNTGPSFSTRCEMSLNGLCKQVASTPKKSPRTNTFAEQLKRLDEQQKIELGVLDDMQEFMRARARLEMEFANGLAKISSTFQSKRKWPAKAYVDGHENILLMDLWRSMLSTSQEEGAAHSVASQQLFKLAGDGIDARKEEKKALFKTGIRVLTNLQEDLCKQDAEVVSHKKEYDHSMKELKMGMKKSVRKRGQVNTSKLESKAETTRHTYLLELAAANKHYLNFRNGQLPEIMETVNAPAVKYMSTALVDLVKILTISAEASKSSIEKVGTLSSKLSPEFEWRHFMHEHKDIFPGRQLFEMEPYSDEGGEARDMSVEGPAKMVLVNVRKLILHSIDIVAKNLASKEEQLESLQSLHEHYTKAGDVFDKTQSNNMRSKMEVIHWEIEALALNKFHLEAKVQKISDTGIDEMLASVGQEAAAPKTAAVMDVGEAQAMEEARRRTYLEAGVDVRSDKGLEEAFRKSYNTNGTNGRSPAASEASSSGGDRQQVLRGPSQISVVSRASTTGTNDIPIGAPSGPPSPPPQSMSPFASALRAQQQKLQRTSSKSSTVSATSSAPAVASPMIPQVDEADDEDEAPPPLPPPPAISEEFTEMSLPPPPPMAPAVATAGFGRASTSSNTRSGLFGHGRNMSVVSTMSAMTEFDELDQAEVPLQYRTIYEYKQAQEDDLPLQQDEPVYVLVVRDDGWCLGLNGSGRIGYFPQSYVVPSEAGDTSLPKPQLIDLPARGPGGHGFEMSGASPVRVEVVAPGTAAHTAGLHPGDMLLEVNGQPCADMDVTSVKELLNDHDDEAIRLCVIDITGAGVSRA